MRDQPLSLYAEAINPQPYAVSRLEISRWFSRQAHPFRGTVGNHMAGPQQHDLRDVGHDFRHRKDHLVGVALLHGLAVDREPKARRFDARRILGRHQPRPEGAECLVTLALYPLSAAIDLAVAFRDIVADAVARHERHRLL